MLLIMRFLRFAFIVFTQKTRFFFYMIYGLIYLSKSRSSFEKKLPIGRGRLGHILTEKRVMCTFMNERGGKRLPLPLLKVSDLWRLYTRAHA